jgi:hypothetical protein
MSVTIIDYETIRVIWLIMFSRSFSPFPLIHLHLEFTEWGRVVKKQVWGPGDIRISIPNLK